MKNIRFIFSAVLLKVSFWFVPPLSATQIMTNPFLNDGFGSQFQEIICSMFYAELNDLTFVYTPFREMEHNYDNDPEFLNKKEWLINFIDHFPVNTNLEIQETGTKYRRCFDDTLLFFAYSESLNKIKTVFRLNKQRENYYDAEQFNIAIHVRRPNPHDSRVLGTNLSDDFYLRIIERLRIKYPSALFHIHSQGNEEEFRKIYGARDVVLHMDEPVEDAFTSMVLADVLVTSTSSLSYVAGFLSEGTVYYIPFWHPPLPGWIVCNATFLMEPPLYD